MKHSFQLDWPRIAIEFGASFPWTALHPSVDAWTKSNRTADGRWAVAFSGGADSLALLLLLWAHWPERRERLLVLHFNHRLRGRESASDAVFCRRVCSALDVAFITASWKGATKGASEAATREARFAFFERVLSRRRAAALWFGHQQDDIAETAFMRLARGSGTAGLAAPRPVQTMSARRMHLRPLLTLKKVEIVAALQSVGAVWREDASNLTGDYFRNRIRNEVLPGWLAASGERDALAGAALSRERLEDDDAALESWVDTLAPLDHGGRLDVRKLAGKPGAVVRRALHRWLGAQADTGDLSRQGFELLLTAVVQGTGTRFSLGRSGFAVIRQGVLFFEKAHPRLSLRRGK